MNKHLHRLLRLTPGVSFDPYSLILQHVDFEDGLKLLTMRQPIDNGQWVRVLKGHYKGDLGFISSTETWGVWVLLIPRLPSRATISSCSDYSPASRPTPALFGNDSELLDETLGILPVCVRNNRFSFEGNQFEHRLICKAFVHSSVSKSVSSMPFDAFCLFWESQHPKLIASQSTFPRPTEWHFAEGDEALVFDVSKCLPVRTKTGHITAIRLDSVDLTTEEGVTTVCWLCLVKAMRKGDFVEVTGGKYKGHTGWVNNIIGRTASVVRKLTENGTGRTEVC